MMYRESLNKQAETLMASHNFADADGKELSENLAIFKANLHMEYAKFADFIRVPRTDEEVQTAKKPVDKAVSYYNDEARMLRLEQLEGLKVKEAVEYYLKNQCVEGFEFGLNRKEKRWECNAIKTVELEAYDFVSFIFELEKNVILDACRIFVDNLAINDIGGEAKIARVGLSSGYIQLRDSKGWTLPKDAKASNKALATQLTQVCKMISAGVAPEMINADVKFVRSMVIDGKSEANQAGTFVTKQDSTIVKAIFRAMYTRYNGLPYQWQNQTKYDKNNPLAMAANKDMGESGKSDEFAPVKTAEAGPVLGSPETK